MHIYAYMYRYIDVYVLYTYSLASTQFKTSSLGPWNTEPKVKCSGAPWCVRWHDGKSCCDTPIYRPVILGVPLLRFGNNKSMVWGNHIEPHLWRQWYQLQQKSNAPTKNLESLTKSVQIIVESVGSFDPVDITVCHTVLLCVVSLLIHQ